MKIVIGQKVYNDELGEGVIVKIEEFESSKYMFVDFERKKNAQFRVGSSFIHFKPTEKFLRRHWSLSKINSSAIQIMEKDFFEEVEDVINKTLTKLQDDIYDSRLGYATNKEINDIDIQKEYSALITAEAKWLNIEKKPYFGKIGFFQDGLYDNFYIGDTEILEKGIIGWADERSILFYQSNLYVGNEKASRNVQLKREFDISNATYFGYEDVIDLLNKEYKKGELSDENKAMITDPRLLKVLERRRNQKEIEHIIATIRSNQYDMITYDRNKNTLVLGCAGSGKTMIMMHRITFLTIRYHSDFQLRNCLIISPSVLLKKQLITLSKKLNIEGGNVFDTNQFYSKLLQDTYDMYESFSFEENLQSYTKTSFKNQQTIYSKSFLNNYLSEIIRIEDNQGKLINSFDSKVNKLLCEKYNISVDKLIMVEEVFNACRNKFNEISYEALNVFLNNCRDLYLNYEEDFFKMYEILKIEIHSLCIDRINKLINNFFNDVLLFKEKYKELNLFERKAHFFRLFIYDNKNCRDEELFEKFTEYLGKVNKSADVSNRFRYVKSYSDLLMTIDSIIQKISGFIETLNKMHQHIENNDFEFIILIKGYEKGLDKINSSIVELADHFQAISLSLETFKDSFASFSKFIEEQLNLYANNYSKLSYINPYEIGKVTINIFDYLETNLPFLNMFQSHLIELENYGFDIPISSFETSYNNISDMLALFIPKTKKKDNELIAKSKYFKNYQSWFSQEQTTSKEVFEFVENLKKSQIEKFELTKFLEDYQEVFFDKMHIEFTDLKAKNVRLGKFLPIINECVISMIKMLIIK